MTAELLHGFEQDTAFVTAEGVTRGQAKALAAYELCADDWWPGYECFVVCRRSEPGAQPFWWIEWGYALRMRERGRA